MQEETNPTLAPSPHKGREEDLLCPADCIPEKAIIVFFIWEYLNQSALD